MRLQARIALATIGCVLALPAGAASAAIFTVNSTADATDFASTDLDCDSTSSSNVCTLRAAIQQARANVGNDTINLPAGVYQLTLAGADEDNPGATGDLDLGEPAPNAAESITIIGAGARSTTVSQTTDDRVFHLISVFTTANLSGLTVTGGNSIPEGGGILNASGSLNLTDVAIVSNSSTQDGGGLSSGSTSNLSRVTVSGNLVDGGGAPAGGGVATGRVGSLSLTNVTISGNRANDTDGSDAQGAGLYFGAPTGTLTNVTLANNTIEPAGSTGGGGIFVDGPLNFRNTIVGLNRVLGGAVSNCFDNGSSTPFANSLGNNLEETTDCGFTASGDQQNTNPQLASLANNGGQTNTRALLAGSPALDAGSNTGCPSVDQRGVTRPQNLICDIGAYEFAPAVILPPPPPPPPPPDDDALPPPRLGRTVNVREVSGRVFFAIPPSASVAGARASQKGLRFRPLREARQLPVGSFLNTRRGSVRLTAARPRAGRTQSGVFSRGLFQMVQSRKKRLKGLTTLRLKGSSYRRCRTGRRNARRADVSISRRLSRRRIRRLRARGRGRFRTRGRYSAATVRGTKWLTVDRCDGTFTKVTQGRVAVRDFRRKRTITLKRGKRYLAKAPGQR